MTSTAKSAVKTGVKPIPEGYNSVTAYLILSNAAEGIEFYKKAFDAKEVLRLPGKDGKIGHAELKLGNSVVMVADEHKEMGARSAATIGGSPVSFLFYVEDVDAVVQRAIDAGAKLERPIENKFYGDRVGGVADPFGYKWYIATHVEDLSPEELEKRAKEQHGG